MGTYNGNEPYVFVSYCHADSEQVLPIIQGLQDRGFQVWYDEGIEVGMAWAKYVGERLEQSHCVLAYVTNHFDDSHNCWQELDFAMEEKKRIIAIKADDGRKLSAGMRMRLGSLQAMPYEKYGSVEKILDTLSQAAVLKPCLAAAAVPANPMESSAEELLEKGQAHYRKMEYEEAVRLYQKAAAQGNTRAQYNLGYCYHLGEGVSRNLKEAVKWYYMAADRGNALAQNNLGYCYQYGEGVLINQENAVKWYRKSAGQGHAPAQYNLGTCYEEGEGVRQNKAEARKWYQKAADQGYEPAIEALKNL